MFRKQRISPERRGVILLVVIVLLTLFAILGLAFVYYSQSEADATGIYRDAQSIVVTPVADIPPSVLLDEYLRQLIYDLPDDATGATSALRGHSLARTMYGWNDGTQYNVNSGSTYGGQPYNANTPFSNDIPYSGFGRVHTSATTPSTFSNPYGHDDYWLINHMWFRELETTYGGPAYVHDPERLPPQGSAGTTAPRTDPTQPRGVYVAGNAPYTYPDNNSLFLASVGSNGQVLMPSFYRTDQDPNHLFGTLDSSNTNWSATGSGTENLKYRVMRPRPADNLDTTGLTTFPAPADAGGDVKNLPGTTGYGGGNNDSIWMDIGFPPRLAPDGQTWFKPLFAAAIVDLDNRLNVNMAGNVRRLDSTGQVAHGSNQGFGPWEINVGYSLSYPAPQGMLPPPTGSPPEWASLLLGRSGITGRYGPNLQPLDGLSAVPATGSPSHSYAQIDFDGVDEINTNGYSDPIALQTTGNSPFPIYGRGWGNGTLAERSNHASLFDRFQPRPYGTSGNPIGDDRAFDVSNMRGLIHDFSSVSELNNSDLGKLLPNNFQTYSRIRHMLTTDSYDIDRPGISPYVYNDTTITALPTTGAYSELYQVPVDTTGTMIANHPPLGPALFTPGLIKRLAPPAAPWNLDNGEYRQIDWRALSTVLGRVDLNRSLTTYPYAQGPPSGPNGTTSTYYLRHDTGAGVPSQFQQAQSDRQQLARDIYLRLAAVSMGGVPAPANITDVDKKTLRWLAQLAVNIVDFIDADDIMTPFMFLPPDTIHPEGNWVFGTEVPHLVINEALGEFNPGAMPSTGNIVSNRVWLELYNPYPQKLDSTGSPDQNIETTDNYPLYLSIPSVGSSNSNAPNATNHYPPYQIMIAGAPTAGSPAIPTIAPDITMPPQSSTGNNDNVLGMVDTTGITYPGANPGAYRTATLLATDTTGLGPDGDFGIPTNIRAVDSTANGAARTGVGSPDPPVANLQFFLAGPLDSAKGVNSPLPNTNSNAIMSGGTPGVPAGTLWLQTDSMQYNAKITALDSNGKVFQTDPPDFQNGGVTVMLRRLANPHIPYQPLPSFDTTGTPSIWYNPYVTVDYLEKVPLYDVTNSTGGERSIGKAQPYTADPSQVNYQASSGGLQHTFGQANSNLASPLDWLVHLDRPLVSPGELLNVSGFQPWQLTHMFKTIAGTNQHQVPWFDQDLATSPQPLSHRLNRAFELFETSNLAAGVSGLGRIPGKINLNTVQDPEVLLGLYDPPVNNGTPPPWDSTAAAAQITNLFLLRNPAGAAPGPASPGGTVQDRPFRGFAAGFVPTSGDSQFSTGLGINDTFFRQFAPANTTGLFEANASGNSISPQPYINNLALSKILNHVTSRSNVFAVYLTVGFFKVVDPAPNFKQPPTLGAELNAATGTNIRHHMFAIVDRSALTIPQFAYQQVTTGTNSVAGQPTVPGNGPATVNVSALQDSTMPPQWALLPGTRLWVDSSPNQELVSITTTGTTPSPNFTANFTKPHSAGFAIYMPLPATSVAAAVAAGSQTVTPAALQDSGTPAKWSIQPGSQLLVDINTSTSFSQEFITVTSVNQSAGSFTATFANAHPNGFQIFLPLPYAMTQSSVPGPGPASIAPTSLSGNVGQFFPAINYQAGMILTVDTGANQETVVITGVNSTSVMANFSKAHAPPFLLYYARFGNPGPQPQFDIRDNSAVVLYASIID
jgi:hypothetical protein